MLLVHCKLEETFVFWCLSITQCQVILIRRFKIFFTLDNSIIFSEFQQDFHSFSLGREWCIFFKLFMLILPNDISCSTCAIENSMLWWYWCGYVLYHVYQIIVRCLYTVSMSLLKKLYIQKGILMLFPLVREMLIYYSQTLM